MTKPKVPDRLAVICPLCDRPSSFYVCGHAEIGGRDDERWPLPALVMLALCEHCGDLAVVTQDWLGELGLDDPYILWPEQERSLNPAIPQQLRVDHLEAQRCLLRAKSPNGAVMLVRRLLEVVCSEHGAKKRGLYDSLEELKALGVIDARLLEWAHGLRVLGNDVAHPKAVPISRQDAEDALDLSEAILDYIYVLRAKFNQFQVRRSKSAGGGGSKP